MIIVNQSDTLYTLNLAPGEELVSVLINFCQEKSIKAAHIVGLGAASCVELAYYHLPTKAYERKIIKEDLEILSLVGNVGLKRGSGELVLHVHGSFGRRDLSVLGGHIFNLTISGAGEVHLQSLPGVIEREYDEQTGLTLMCCGLGSEI
jgi:uncharacterized protein